MVVGRIKKEQYITNLIKTNFNQTKAYKLTNPNSSYQTAKKNSYKIYKHLEEWLDKFNGFNLDKVDTKYLL